MSDQAAALRQMIGSLKEQPAPTSGARVVAVASGKGGVGKTSLAVNLAVALGKQGRRVVVVDADFGLANVDVLMGVTPAFTLADVVSRRVEIQEALCRGPYGVRFISGGSGVWRLMRLSGPQLAGLMDGLRRLDEIADVVLLDTGAGVSESVLRLIAASQEVVVVTTPEPTAMMDAYALIKSIVVGNVSTPKIRLLVNRAEGAHEGGDTLKKLAGVVRLYLHIEVEELGVLPNDETASRAVRLQQPFVVGFPQSGLSRSVENVARRFMDREPERQSGLRAFLLRMTGG